jgi:hypothetical protein
MACCAMPDADVFRRRSRLRPAATPQDGVAAARALPPTAARELPSAQPGSASANGFWLSFDARGKYGTGFKKCMLPGNINGRIATFANKNEGFDRHLFSKTGQIGG